MLRKKFDTELPDISRRSNFSGVDMLKSFYGLPSLVFSFLLLFAQASFADTLLIRNATIISGAPAKLSRQQDVFIENGKSKRSPPRSISKPIVKSMQKDNF